jgi:hypothetical protein
MVNRINMLSIGMGFITFLVLPDFVLLCSVTR